MVALGGEGGSYERGTPVGPLFDVVKFDPITIQGKALHVALWRVTLSLSLSHSHTLTLSRSLTHSLTLSLTHSLTLSHTHLLTLSHTPTGGGRADHWSRDHSDGGGLAGLGPHRTSPPRDDVGTIARPQRSKSGRCLLNTSSLGGLVLA